MERIQDEVARAGLSESYSESGPQSVTQLVISFSRGCEMVKYQDTSIFVVFRSVRCFDHFRSGCICVEPLVGIFSRLLHRANSRPGQSSFSIISSRFPSCVLLTLSWNTNENLSTDKLSRPIILYHHLLLGFLGHY